MPTNWKQLKAIEQKNRERILAVCPCATENSGCYIFFRTDEELFKYAYIGQAKRLLTRLAQHLSGYEQHIDRSIKKHGLYSESNPYGWQVSVIECSESELNELERKLIREAADQGFQLRNITSGGQDSGKTDINERKPTRGYRDGVKQGERNVIKKIAHWFDLYLDANIQVGKADYARAQKALTDFYNILQGESEE